MLMSYISKLMLYQAYCSCYEAHTYYISPKGCNDKMIQELMKKIKWSYEELGIKEELIAYFYHPDRIDLFTDIYE